MKNYPDPTSDLAKQIEESSTFLYRFYFHHEPFTSRDVNAGIKRLQGLCREAERQFGSGRYSSWSAATVKTAAGHIDSARSALAVMQEG